MSKAIIEIKGLYKSYEEDKEPVLKDVNISVEAGTIHGLIGHNGSGKTTIIKCLTGIFPPDKGEVIVDGKAVYESNETKQKIGYVADSNQLFKDYRVSQMVTMYEQMFVDFSREEFESLNEKFNVKLNKKIGQLSKGQQMRTSFMLNMARNPLVLVLDEPTSGLDAIAKKDLLDILVCAVENKNMTVLISSHHLSELEKICDTVTMIKNGAVQFDDSLDEVSEQIQKYQVVFPEGAPSALYEMDNIYDMSNVGSVYTIVLCREQENFEEDMKQMGAVLVERMAVGLEESFIYMNKENNGKEVKVDE